MNLRNVTFICVTVLTFFWLSFMYLSQSYEIDRATRIPPPPLIESVNFEGMNIKNDPEKVESVRELFNPDTLKAMHNDGLQPMGLDDDSLPLLWLLEVANFDGLDEAKAMTDKLRQKGHRAFIHVADDTNIIRYHVYVGPKIDRRRIVSEKLAIDDAFGTDALVLQFAR